MKACPVCKRPDLADGLKRCPQCNTDLECFDLLDALQEKPADQAAVPPKPIAVEAQPGETGSRIGELHGSLAPSGPGTRKIRLAVGLVLVLLLVLFLFVAFVGNRYLGERIDRLENRLASAGNRTGPSSQEWSQLYGAVQALNTRMEGLEQQLSGLTTQQANVAAEVRQERSKLEGGLSAMLERLSRVDAQLAALDRQQDTGRKELKETMAELAASFPPSVRMNGSTPPPSVQTAPTEPSVTATPAQPSAFTEYQAGPAETLWRIARRFYGKGIYYPVLLEDNPGLAVHGHLEGRTIRIARQREHAQETYRRLVFTEGGRTLFRYRARAGESWRSLARVFYGSERQARELAELNGTPQPVTERVLIPLD